MTPKTSLVKRLPEDGFIGHNALFSTLQDTLYTMYEDTSLLVRRNGLWLRWGALGHTVRD